MILKGRLLIVVQTDRVWLEIGEHKIPLTAEAAVKVGEDLIRGAKIITGVEKPIEQDKEM